MILVYHISVYIGIVVFIKTEFITSRDGNCKESNTYGSSPLFYRKSFIEIKSSLHCQENCHHENCTLFECYLNLKIK